MSFLVLRLLLAYLPPGGSCRISHADLLDAMEDGNQCGFGNTIRSNSLPHFLSQISVAWRLTPAEGPDGTYVMTKINTTDTSTTQ